MDLEIVILNEVRQRRISCGICYMQNLKRNDKNELIYRKRLTDSQNKPMLTGGKDGGRDKEFGMDTYTLFKMDNQLGPIV